MSMDDTVNCNMAADSGMDTCPSPETQDSRKRPLDGDVENGVTKKSHYAGGSSSKDIDIAIRNENRKVCSFIVMYVVGADGTYHFKMLVPSIAAGAIIGKGGETIAQLQKDAGARVKMSKANDFYPGTSERVCLITGSVDAIMSVLTFIMEKIREKPDKIREKPDLNAKQAIDFDSKTAAERDKQVKILVPNSTAGMIIGKAGNYIKQIKEESGSYVQISQKAKDQTLQERCITVIGDIESNKTACLMILTKVVEDPQSGACLNVSYADVSGPVANYNPRGSPYANHSNQQTPMHTSFNSSGSLNASISSVGGMLLDGGFNLSLNLGSPSGGTSLTSQLLERIKLTLRSSGYSDQATSEITAAMTTLAQYGILGMGLGLTPGSGSASSSNHALVSGSYLGVSPMESASSPHTANGVSNSGGVFGPIGTVSGLGSSPSTPRSGGIDRYKAGIPGGGYDCFRRQSSPSNVCSSLATNTNFFGFGASQQQPPMSICKSPTPSELKGDQKKIEREIPEYIVGAILGPGGSSLVEIQHMSCANIQISKKGTFAPGTRNRIVTIAGSPNAINTAQYLIEQRISEEEAKRAKEGLAILQ